MGTCKYTLWNSTIANDPCEFRIETKNERRHGNSTVAWTWFIDFYMKNTKIRFLRGGLTLVSVFYNYFIIVLISSSLPLVINVVSAHGEVYSIKLHMMNFVQ
jgi:hypothetical protein